ncbi:hypothetical protein D3C76_1802190 [compost metagenome]
MVEEDAQGQQQLAALGLVVVDQRSKVTADKIFQRPAVIEIQQELEHPEFFIEHYRLLITRV